MALGTTAVKERKSVIKSKIRSDNYRARGVFWIYRTNNPRECPNLLGMPDIVVESFGGSERAISLTVGPTSSSQRTTLGIGDDIGDVDCRICQQHSRIGNLEAQFVVLFPRARDLIR